METISSTPSILLIVRGLIITVASVIFGMAKYKEERKSFIFGVIVYAVFGLILASIAASPLAGIKTSSSLLFCIIWPFIPAICEETGRLIGYKVLLQNKADQKNAVFFGLGHGTLESFLAITYLGFQYLSLINLIKTNQIESNIKMMEQVGNTAGIESLQNMITVVSSYTVLSAVMAIISRVLILNVHILLSVIVSKTVREKNIKYYLLAVLIHAVIDVPAGMNQVGILPLWAAQVFVVIVGVIGLAVLLAMRNKAKH